ncbi:proton-conducting transporter transmembrane domain-containing protein [Pseudoponticoccus marisrubri]|uniref:Probable inorganic carbon transporter subunit DabB n=1 Tax=Pseudoponticoccus marisrubri TaxID=1685382 RepID=A0A0W7WE55_9RHOB|nr:proton-conducting transporter membrane subunit [Pseudoponticoccus marisrubri]KUF08750.1 oxidoreductase [Pseudoponticoccus marisrubri]
MYLAWMILLAPAALLLAGALRLRETGMPATPPRGPERAALLAVLLALAGAVTLLLEGPVTSPVLGLGEIGLSVRLDMVSVTLMGLSSVLAWVILRFSATHLQGEPGEGRFAFWMALTLAGVMLLVSAGHLAQLALGWALTGLGVNRLLMFYPDRPGARRAARKKMLVARGADTALAAALVLMVLAFGTSEIAAITEAAAEGPLPPAAQAAVAALALAALLKSALIPAHGWLTEVMEAPTPVSALLHAGVVNAGGFLLIRFADLLLGAPLVMAALVTLGGLSALLGAVVMLTQAAAKTALAWSTVSQMGFMVLQCGLGLFPLALLHVVAHALYKAHAFLRVAEAGQAVMAARRLGPVAVPSLRNVGLAMGIAVAIYALVGLPLGLAGKPPQAVALGAMLVLGVGYLVAQGLADAAPRALGIATARASALFAAGYFAFQALAGALAAGTLPPPPQAGALEWALIVLALASFAAVALLQALLPAWAHHPAARGLRVHIANGFYLNALTDRLVGAWSTPRPAPQKEI